MGSVNPRHLNSNMNPAVFVILAVVGLSAAAPQPSGHGSSFKHKTQCHTVYKTIYETACDVTYKKECYGYGYDKKCKSVPVEKCHQVPQQIPRESCKDIPIPVPVQVPREICDKIPKQVPRQIPEKKCDSY